MKRYIQSVICLAALFGCTSVVNCASPMASAATVTTSHRLVPTIDKQRTIQVLLDYLQQSSEEQYFAGFPGMEREIKIGSNHRVAFRASDTSPRVLLVDLSAGYSPYWDLHLILWKTHEGWQYQELPDFPNTFQTMQARVAVLPNGMPEVGVFYDSSRGSGSPVPVFVLLQMKHQRWEIAWKTPALPPTMDHGDAWFIGNGLSHFALEYDSWQSKDPKEHIFSECHPCLHRRYRYIWQREGNSKYVLGNFGPIDSPYNTLTSFIYLLSVGRTTDAARYVTDPTIVQKALTLGLQKEPGTVGWFINYADRERGPYRITSGPARGTEITFLVRHNQVLIAALNKG